MPWWGLPLLLYHGYISNARNVPFLWKLPFKRHEDKKETIGVSRGFSKHTLDEFRVIGVSSWEYQFL